MKNALNHMNSNGFNPPDLTLDGRIHRWGDKKRSNWYIGFSNFARSTGQPFVVVQYGSWKSGEIFNYSSSADFTTEDKKFIKAKIEESKRKAQHEKEKLQAEVAEESQSFFEKLNETEITSYMQRKSVTRHFGTRAQFGNLYVPVRDVDGRLWSTQTINESGAKYFAEGGRVTGCFHSIGDFVSAENIYICEGFATGVSIYESIQRPVVIAFNAYNIQAVSDELKKRFPDKRFIICGDDDRWSKNAKGEEINPGREKATEAAKKIMGIAIFPVFKSLDGNPTDFNDLFVREGKDAVKKQIEPIKGERHFVRPLGFHGKEYFFTSTANQQVVQIHAFSETDFLNLMPKEYWEQLFPGQRVGIDWQKARSELMAQARSKGIFNPMDVRGSGVWMDQGDTVVNMGDHVLTSKGSTFSLSDFKSEYFYSLGRSLPKIKEDPLSVDDCNLLVEICDTFRWRKRDFGKFMAGYLVIAKICGSLPIRPHVWLTGGSQTGKSTLLQKLIFPTLKNYSVYFLGGTTEAGLRQALDNDSVPIIFDEFETNSAASSEKIQGCIEFMRSAWSDTGGGVAKGSSGGSAKFYRPRFSAIVSSIRPALVNDADRSRFTIMELAPHGNDAEHWNYLKGLIGLYDQTFIDRLFVRTMRNVGNIVASYETIRAALSQRVGSRFGEQHGMLLAGYWMLKSDCAIDAGQACELVDSLELEDETSDAKVTDEQECLNHLMTTKVKLDLGRETTEKSIEELLDENYTESSGYIRKLQLYGLKLSDDGLFVQFSNSELKSKIFEKTRWVNCWSTSLMRIPGAKRTTARFFRETKKCVFVPLKSQV